MEINVLQIISQIVNFGVVFGALTFLLYKPMLKAIDERRKKTEDAERFAADAMKEKEELEGMKKRTKTQATCNGGTATRINSFIDVRNAKIFR